MKKLVNLMVMILITLVFTTTANAQEKTDLEVIQQIKDGLTRIDADVDKYKASLPYFFARVSGYKTIWTYQTKFDVVKEGKRYEVIFSENLDPQDWVFEIKVIMTAEMAKKYGTKRFIYIYLDANGNHLDKKYELSSNGPNDSTPQAALGMIVYLESLKK